jgi:hypothetical protein
VSSPDIALLLDFLSLGNRPPGGSQAAAAEQWRALSQKPGLSRLLRHEGAELWLYRRLRDLGFAGQSPFDEALRLAAHRDTLRGLRIDGEAVATLTRFREAGIPCALLKGQARRAASSLYPYADARPSSDVDLLLPEHRAQEAWDLLVAAGYTHAVDPARSYADHFHLPPVWGPDKVAVELHTSTARQVTAAEAWRRATHRADVLTWSGLEVTVPSATELLWHGLAHAFLHGEPGRLRAFLDGAVILASGREVDWDCIRSRIASDEVREADASTRVPPDIQRRWLAAAAALAGTSLPADLAVSLPHPTRRLLRWRHLVLGSAMSRTAKQRLIEEASRCELATSISPSHPNTPGWKRIRHLVAGTTASVCYRSWRTLAAE